MPDGPGTAMPDGPRGPGTGRAGYLGMRVGEFLDELAAAGPARGVAPPPPSRSPSQPHCAR